MEWTFELVGSEFVRIKASGEFRSSRYAAMLDELVSLPYWRPGTPLLFDFAGLRYSAIDPVELLAASDEVVRRGEHFALTPVAIVMGTPADLEMGRRFGEITDHRVLARPGRFLNEAEAVSWLRSSLVNLICFTGLTLPSIPA